MQQEQFNKKQIKKTTNIRNSIHTQKSKKIQNSCLKRITGLRTNAIVLQSTNNTLK